MMRKVVLCGTHPQQFNGYSRVVFELAREISKFDDIQLYIFGFQNFYDDEDHKKERSLPKNVNIYDAHLNEEPKNKGFGENLLVDYLKSVLPDVVIIYNDVLVVSSLLQKIHNEIPEVDRTFKLIPYIDLVYKNERQSFLNYINANIDGAIAFTDYWKDVLLEQGFTKPLWVLEHAFNKQNNYPIPKSIARKYFELDEKSFIILNLNRNQPRKRWDICIIAFMKFISKHRNENIKLLVMTSITGAWNLSELIAFEGKKYGMDLNEAKKFFIFIQNPQKLTDSEINIMYNVADIGINTCAGEGFGLCNFDQAGVGVPQVVPYIGGFRDFFNETNSITIKPSIEIYGDTGKDNVGGIEEICTADDFTDALERYYLDRNLIIKHGKQARTDILKYDWKSKASHLREIVMECTKDFYSSPEDSSKLMDDINSMFANDKNEHSNTRAVNEEKKGTPLPISMKTAEKSVEEDLVDESTLNMNIDDLIEEKLKNRVTENHDINNPPVEKMSKSELKLLQLKIDKLLENTQ